MLYTLILEYDGGTFISQQHAESPKSALTGCVIQLPIRDLPVDLIIQQFNEDGISALDEMTGVWCCTASFGGKLVIGNIVATADKNE